jgi:hypothetical protein
MSFDPGAFILALVVAAVTILEFRRNRSVQIKIVDVSTIGTTSIHENFGQHFLHFRILILNTGRPLHNVAMILHFRDYRGAGHMTVPLRRFSLQQELEFAHMQEGEFGYGMVGYFGIKSYHLAPHDIQFLSNLKNAAEQHAQLIVFSQGYRAKSFKIGVGRDLLALRWNQFAWRINPKFDSTVRLKGKTFHKSGALIPVVPVISVSLMDFVKWAQQLPPPMAPQPNQPFFGPPNPNMPNIFPVRPND